MGKIEIIGILLFLVVNLGCIRYDKDNVYQPKPALQYSYPNVTCNGANFSKIFPYSSYTIKLTDSTFAVSVGNSFLIYNDSGVRIDSIYSTNINSSTIGKVIPFWDGSGFFFYAYPFVFAYSNTLKFLWKSNTNLVYNYDDVNIVATSTNTLIIEQGNIFYSMKPNQTAIPFLDLSFTVKDVQSIACLPNGKILACTFKKDYPGNSQDVYIGYEILLNGQYNELPQFEVSTNLNLQNSLNKTSKGGVSWVRVYSSNNSYYQDLQIEIFDSTYNSINRAFILNNVQFYPNKSIPVSYLGNGYSIIYQKPYNKPAIIFDETAYNFIVPYVRKSNSIRSLIEIKSIELLRRNKLLITGIDEKIPNYPNEYVTFSNQFTQVVLTDFDGDYCK